MKKPIQLMTVEEAQKQDIIRRHWQSAWRSYQWSADGCGDNLYRDRTSALKAYKNWCLLNVVIPQAQIDRESD